MEALLLYSLVFAQSVLHHRGSFARGRGPHDRHPRRVSLGVDTTVREVHLVWKFRAAGDEQSTGGRDRVKRMTGGGRDAP